MKYISLVEDRTRELPFYLAMEEYVAKYLDLDEAFFMWQVEPTVIFGRNQLIEKEVNLSYCRANNISTYRRKSGGGCVYADKGNIMISYVSKNYSVSEAYGSYLEKIVNILIKLGVNAYATGRNDIVIDDKKISGNAFYHVNGKSVVHGTMLYETDMENMINAITPADIKLTSKGVDSVKSRITTLKNYLNIGIEDFKYYIKNSICDEIVVLNEAAIKKIEELEQMYLSDSFIYGKNPYCNIVKEQWIDGVGEIKAFIEVDKGVIKNINLMGDYFLNEEMDTQLLESLKGITYNEIPIRNALAGLNVGDIILNMTNEQFIKLIII